jgi:hypothetical protein
MFKSERPTYKSTSWSSLIYFASRLVGDRVFHPDTKCSFLPKVLACLTTPPKTALAKAAVADWAASIQKPLVVMMLAVLCVSEVVAYPARARGLAEEPEIWVNDASGTESDSPFFPIEVAATLSSSSTQEITVDYSTEDGSAKAGVNYTSTSGTLTFASGSLFGHIKIPIMRDHVFTDTLTFYLVFSNPVNATMGPLGNKATCTIANIDPPPPRRPTLSVSVIGNGTVVSDPGGITCTDRYYGQGACTMEVDIGTTVTLQETSGTHPEVTPCFVYFLNWGGECSSGPCTVTVTGDVGVSALFGRSCGTPVPRIFPPPPVPPPAPPGGREVSGSGSGGMESLPLWMFKKRPAATAAVNPAPAQTSKTPPYWMWGKGHSTRNSTTARNVEQDREYAVALAELMPAAVAGASRSLTHPKDVIGNSNALETLGADYIDAGSNTTIASIDVFRTAGTVYTHDYALCSRFKNGQLEYAIPADLSPELGTPSAVYFWFAGVEKPSGGKVVREEAAVFAVYVSDDERTFTIDSKWTATQYASADNGYFLTFQLWATDSAVTIDVLNQLVRALASIGAIRYKNTQTPIVPQAFLSSAYYDSGQARLQVINPGQNPRVVNFSVIAWSAPNPESETHYSFARTAVPGVNVIHLPLPRLLNGVIYSDDGAGFLDAVYLADGDWFTFDDSTSGGASSVSWSSSNCAKAANLTDRDFVLTGCAELSGKVGVRGWAGLARGMDPPARPFVDLSKYKALTFFARGDGKSYRVNIETDSVAKLQSADWHQFVFTATPEWRQLVIPLSAFAQQGWDPAKLTPFTGRDVKAVSWVSIGDPLDSIKLDVDRVGFVNSTAFVKTTLLQNDSDVAGPHTLASLVTDDVGLQSVTALFSLDGGRSYSRIPMAATGEAFLCSIPGQPLNTEVRYYVEATDSDGNVATDPPDAPYVTYRFQVSAAPSLLVNDFNRTDTANLLGGNSFLFNSDAGGSIASSYDRESLRLSYDVSAAGSFAGYNTLLKGANLAPYKMVTFDIRGAEGGERVKIGVRDTLGNEQKIAVGEYLPGGVTTAWRHAAIPLQAFGRIARWPSMESFVVAFENKVGSGKGAIYLDNIKFEPGPDFSPITVDNFDEPTDENGVGGSLFTSSGGGASIETSYDPVNRQSDSGNGYAITFRGVNASAWAAAGSSLERLDVSKANKLSLYVKGASGGERPHVYLASANGATENRAFVELTDYVNVSTTWRRADIPLSVFRSKGVDLTSLSYFQLAFEWRAMSGTVYLDDIRILGDGGAPAVHVLFPNTNGDVLKAGTSPTITWQSSSSQGIVSQDVLLSTDDGASFSTLASGLPGAAQSYVFDIPASQPMVKKARIRVIAIDAAGNIGQDDSDESFKIKAARR